MRGLQWRAINFALTMCDVKTWPVPVVKSHVGKGKEVYVSTDLPLRDRLHSNAASDRRHSIDLRGYESIEGIEIDHIVSYASKRRFLGVRTVCGNSKSCRCRELLPKYWHLGWVMTY
jgi:hypothetical protein